MLLISTFVAADQVFGQNAACKFDDRTLQFIGTPVEQARCLLRPNRIGGVLGTTLIKLPKPLESLIGKPSHLDRTKLRKYLTTRSISESDIGGSLDLPLSTATLPNGDRIEALYFIIHDTSTPYLKDEPFPAEMDNDPLWKGNKIEIWLKNPVAHVFVNRLGRSVTTTPFNENVKNGFGTKFARDFLKADAKGLQIHIELVQPRRRDPEARGAENDRIAPTPGFSDAQYERLALLYITASARRGSWLIPAYHSAIDAGIPDAHDDPQNFDLDRFASVLDKMIKKLR